ncbi:hypothetical protein HFP89_03230 [Wenzhouxiangella sp. XN79A]|uniref:hypothetical protein n=1 Tax=Wenzhouxiangella sp. XN79A TaxID=2724193 RepID=UPI00144AA500|nr:hypothetical protein [Wenzhouxiangella sp. XN79A]NKI34177.1 hypothetical protein [Wenzhouxiangella sp. XN79A]
MFNSEKTPAVEAVKSAASTGALIFSIVIIAGLIFTGQTSLAQDIHPVFVVIVLTLAVVWLSIVEGGQASLVGLAPVSHDLYAESHRIAHKSCVDAHSGDSLDRYLLGRQFMVVFIVFAINIAGGPVSGAELWGFPQWLLSIFLGVGLAMILFTTMCGQLNSQVNASHCMLDYLNTWPNYFTFRVAKAIEFSGIVHASYIIQIIVASLAGKKTGLRERPRSDLQDLFFYFRCFMSLVLLIFAFVITLAALFEGKTTMWESVPNVAAVVVFFLLMCVVGLLEGMQIAFFAVSKLPEDERGDNVWAKKTCRLLFRGDAHNLSAFMIGRQLCVVSCMFFIARVTSFDIDPGAGDATLWGIPAWAQIFLNTGFLGALITTILASIAWQLVASAFPIAFLSNPFTYVLLRLCLALKATGICNGAYVIAWIHRKIAGFQRDEVYIGTAEERRARAKADNLDKIRTGTGHLLKLPAFVEDAPESLKELARNDTEVQEYISSIHKQADIESSKP